MTALRDGRARGAEGTPDVDSNLLADVAFELHSLHAAHVAIGARTVDAGAAPPGIVAVLRQQHTWLLQNWHVVEQCIPADASPARLATMFALGWAQCLTTARWPDTPRWRTLLAGPAPPHWWPRVHWHLCWLTATPDHAEHRALLSAALAEGDADPELAPLAPA